MTFSADFVKQLEWFQTPGVKRALPGVVLYNGEQPFNIRGGPGPQSAPRGRHLADDNRSLRVKRFPIFEMRGHL